MEQSSMILYAQLFRQRIRHDSMIILSSTLLLLACDSKEKVVTEEYGDNRPKTISELVNGKREGIEIDYSREGKVTGERYFVDDTLTGFRYYDDEGEVTRSAEFLDGIFYILFYGTNEQIVQRAFLRKRKIFAIEKFDANGQRDSAEYIHVEIPMYHGVKRSVAMR
jgi:antitoxin component YwqK of YwqJK toxin-antitoxin module